MDLVPQWAIERIGAFTRRVHPRGTERLLRIFNHPDKIDGIKTVIPYDGDMRILIDTSSLIEWKTFFYGYYEPEISELVKKHLPPGGVFVDIGANVGVHVLVAAKIAKEVIAIEPVPAIADRLQDNLDLNGITNVRVFRLAASDVESTTQFYLPGDGTSHMGIGSIYKDHARGSRIEVPTIKLDSLLEGKKVDLIKIDTEGHDGKVLFGAKQVIERHRPVVIFEYTKSSWGLSGISLDMAKEVFKSYDFEILGSLDSCNIICTPRK